MRYLNFLVLFFFTFQNAFGSPSHFRDQLQSTTLAYNGLTQPERWAQAKKLVESMPKQDQDFFDERWQEAQQPLPNVKVKEGIIQIEFDKKIYELEIKDEKTIVFKGKEIPFTPGTYAKAVEELTLLIAGKKSTFISFFISEAHANPAYLIGFVIAVVVLIMKAIHDNGKASDAHMAVLENVCTQFEQSSPNPASQHYQEELKGQIEFANKEYLERKCPNKTPACIQLAKNKACLRSLSTGQVNDTPRGDVKDTSTGIKAKEILTPKLKY